MTHPVAPVLLASVVLALVGAAPAAGGCAASFPLETGNALLLSYADWGGVGGDGRCAYYGCYESESRGPVSPDFRGVFWALGAGDPAVGLGIDSGGLSVDQWTKHRTLQLSQLYYYLAWMTQPDGVGYLPGTASDWSQAGDGCVLEAGATEGLDGTECTAVLLADHYEGHANVYEGYFAFLTSRVDAAGTFPFPVSDSVPIHLEPMPKPFIAATRDAAVTIAPPTVPQDALYLDPACESPVGYKLYIQREILGGGFPKNRSRENWSPAVGGATADDGPLPIDQPAVVSTGCARDVRRDVYIALSFVFDGGFETPYLSPISTRISCMPCLGTDFDNDGFCAEPLDGSAADCDDANAMIHPGAPERCNAIDDDCDGRIDDDDRGEDFDADGVPAACDNCPIWANALQDDVDGDGVGDLCDDCPLHRNPEQADRDGDTEGDACDLDDGMIYIRFASKNLVEWQNESGFAAWNSYRGDLAELRGGGAYTQLPGSNALAQRSCGLPEPQIADDVDPEPDQAAFFLTTGVATGESDLGDGTNGARPNANPCE